jgi:hypothetical protein
VDQATRAPGSGAQPRDGKTRRAPRAGQAVSTAVLFATAPAGDGSPAAALAWEQTNLLGRLLDQLADLGIRRAQVITRPGWADPLAAQTEGHDLAVTLQVSPDLAGDLRALEAIARAGGGSLVVTNGDILTQGEALAGLLADPRIATGILATTVRRIQRERAFRTRGRRGRVISAGSPYHYIHQPNGTFLGVLKIAPLHRTALADVAGRLAALVDGELPAGWGEELAAKAGRWRVALHRRTLAGIEPEAREELGEPVPEEETELATEDEIELVPDDLALSPEDEAELERRVAAARHDVPSLMLCGLVRSDVPVTGSHLRRLLWARPLTPDDVARAAERIGQHDEDRALLNSAVKANDGFFTTFFVSPYSKYIARWAARRGWTPNGVTTLSVVVGFVAAAAFATGDRAGMVAGAILLQLAFTLDCVDGQLARYTRTFTKLGAWLDSIFDRTKEYAIFAGLAIGAARSGDDVWLLAGAALALQVMRHSIDFSYPTAQRQTLGAQPPLEQVPDFAAATVHTADPVARPPAPPRPTLKQRVARGWRRIERSRRLRWVRKMIAFPIGERFAAISVTAALFDARATFIVLLVWGVIAACYTIPGRVLRSAGRRAPVALGPGTHAGTLEAYRDDGPLALALGRIPAPPVAPIQLIVAGMVPAAVAIVFAGAGASWTLAGAALAWLIVVAGISSGRPLRDWLRWVVPPALRVAEYGGLLWIAAVAGADAVPAAFALLCAITFRHYDVVYRLRQRGVAPPRWLHRAAGGWDGRLLAGFVLAAAGAAVAGFYVAAVVLAVVFVGESIASWVTFGRAHQVPAYEDDEDDAE